MSTGFYFPNRGNGTRTGKGAFAGKCRDNRYFYGPFESRETAKFFSAFHHDSSVQSAPVEEYTEYEIEAIMDDACDNIAYRWIHPREADYNGLTYVDVKAYWYKRDN